MLICLSGISGVGKTTIGKIVTSKIPRTIFVDQDSYFIQKKPVIKLSNGEIVSNYDCLEAIDWEKLNKDLHSLMKEKWNVLLVGFALWEEKLEMKPNFHFLLSDFDLDSLNSSKLEERCIQSRSLSKNFKNKERDQLMVREVLVPFYLLSLKKLGDFIVIRTSFLNDDGKLVKYNIEDIVSSLLINIDLSR
jgi:hypothetical protein